MHSKYGRNAALVVFLFRLVALPGQLYGQNPTTTADEKLFEQKGSTPISGLVHGRIADSVVVNREMLAGPNHSATIEPAVQHARLGTVRFSNTEHSTLQAAGKEVGSGSDRLPDELVYTPETSSANPRPLSLLSRTIPPLRRYEPGSTYTPLVSSILLFGAGVFVSHRYESRYRDLEWERTVTGKLSRVTPEDKRRVNEIENELEELRPMVGLGNVLMATGAVGYVVSFPLEGLLFGGRE